ncbi:MAG: hypothetical protein RL722_2260 [Pseudomonadota bacterium]
MSAPGAAALDIALDPALDLNLLRLFVHLHELRRVSRVAERLGLSQPAVSNALARLRTALGDPLFIPTPGGMQPTPRAQALAGPIQQALAQLQQALARPADFDPARSSRVVTLGMTDIGEIFFLPTLMQALAERAPGMSLRTVRPQGPGATAATTSAAGADPATTDLKAALTRGEVDLAIGLHPQLESGFHRRPLFPQRYVCLLRQGHALAGRGAAFSLADFSAADHLVVVAPGTGHGRVDELLNRAGISRRVRLTVPHFVAVGHILARTDLIATVPERLAERLAPVHGLIALPHPVSLPAADIALYWHARNQGDAGHQWLRQLVGELFSDAGAQA